MEIEVRLFATLQEYVPKGEMKHTFTLAVGEGTQIEDVLTRLKIPEKTPKILLVNGKYAPKDSVLRPGDVLSIFPPVGGG
jgi:molybdopterin synthase sulfur carrier subunit